MEAVLFLGGAVVLAIVMNAFIQWSERRDMRAAVREIQALREMEAPANQRIIEGKQWPLDVMPAEECKTALTAIGKALCASHGCVATDLPEARVTDTSWRIDHTPEMAHLAGLEAAFGVVSSDAAH